MKELQVHFLVMPDRDIHSVAHALRGVEKHALEFAPWKDFPYKPDVHFSIACDNVNFYLQYNVREKHLQAAHTTINGPVYQDSCVEFFISFDDAAYYNFELNCIGTVLAEFGEKKVDRQRLPVETLEKIRSQSLIRRGEAGSLSQWELTIILPLEVFTFHNLSSLKGSVCRANFYKCGDNLPEPHYLSWSNIQSDRPDFHLPEFFGRLHFADEP